MINTRLSLCIVVLVVAGLQPASIPRARAGALDRFASEDTLIASPWKITYGKQAWFTFRLFKKDGTFLASNSPDEPGHWEMTDTKVVMTFADRTQESLALPLSPQGAAGTGKVGGDFTAVQVPAQPGDIELALVTAPAPELDPAAKQAAIAVLTSGPLKVSGNVGGWARTRIIERNGTFSTKEDSKERGRWKIFRNLVVMDFADGHKDIVILPLIAGGGPGFGSSGEPLTCAPQNPPPVVAATPAPLSTPVVELTEQEKTAAVAMLVSGPWRVTGSESGGWSRVRLFDAKGSFTTPGVASEYGRWKLSGNKIIMTFADAHKDTISLPLNPRGTPGTDAPGNPTTFALVSAIPNSAQKPTAPGDGGSRYFGTSPQVSGTAQPQQ